MKAFVICAFFTAFVHFISPAQQKTENVIVVTLDGMRWQEMFTGADSVLINDSTYVGNIESTKKKFWAPSASERREKLFPFIWNEIVAKGQIYGNRNKGNLVNNANKYWFSYPGYNEMFTGFPDPDVNSNEKNPNKNESIFAFLNKQAAYKGKIAAFTSWDVYDAILNEPASGIYVSSGFDTLSKKLISDPKLELLNEMQFMCPKFMGEPGRPDMLTYYMAKSYLLKFRPKVLYIAFLETDVYAHHGEYDNYLDAASLADKWLADLWNTIQSIPQYKNKTTLIVTTDHGRGDAVKRTWRGHGAEISDCGQIWIAAMGPDTKAKGELTQGNILYQKQIAATIGKLLGKNFVSNHPVADPIEAIYSDK